MGADNEGGFLVEKVWFVRASSRPNRCWPNTQFYATNDILFTAKRALLTIPPSKRKPKICIQVCANQHTVYKLAYWNTATLMSTLVGDAVMNGPFIYTRIKTNLSCCMKTSWTSNCFIWQVEWWKGGRSKAGKGCPIATILFSCQEKLKILKRFPGPSPWSS